MGNLCTPCLTYANYNHYNNNENEIICSICYETINEDKHDTICNHSFHKNCLLTWTDTHDTMEDIDCPLCRTKLLTDKTKELFASRGNAKYNDTSIIDDEIQQLIFTAILLTI
jgi:hypothetical protein